jgi:hypothetical protein
MSLRRGYSSVATALGRFADVAGAFLCLSHGGYDSLSSTAIID